MKKIKELIPYVVIIIIVVLIRTFIATPIKVNGTSMNDTLEHRDTMILNKIDVKINGKKIEDPYYKNNNTSDFESVKIPKNYYFVLGDNRSDSIDSRIIGPVNIDDIKGTTKLVIFPFKNIGIVN